jgi:hypothetical protein
MRATRSRASVSAGGASAGDRCIRGHDLAAFGREMFAPVAAVLGRKCVGGRKTPAVAHANK